MTEYRYRSLPSGNELDFKEIGNFLLDRGVRLEYHQYQWGGRMFRIPIEDLHLLPSDEDGPYFGTDESGFSLHGENVPLDIWKFREDMEWNWQTAVKEE